MSRHSLMLQTSAICVIFLAYQIKGARLYPVLPQGNDSLGQDMIYGLAKRKLANFNSNINGTINPRESSGDDVRQFAAHVSPVGNYYGLHATMDVYGHNLKRGQLSTTVLWVSHSGDGAESSLNSIDAGWHIYPEHYGDSKPHFFTYWTRDNYDKTGCFNMDCPGFVRADGATIAPGALIHRVSNVGDAHLQNVTIRVLKDNKSGDWWVYYGFNSVPTAVGYYPKSLFTYLGENANQVEFGAFVIAKRVLPTPPMGSGANPKGAGPGRPASFNDLRLIDQDGRSIPITEDLPYAVSSDQCYTITPVDHAECFYGGPGGCIE